jgi:hypothetical protein
MSPVVAKYVGAQHCTISADRLIGTRIFHTMLTNGSVHVPR